MSAYHVGQEHINALVSYAKYIGSDLLRQYSPSEWGQILSVENDKSVNYRYNEETLTPYQWEEDLYFCTRYTPIDVLKMIDSYEYQSCEHSQWETSEAKSFCEALRQSTIYRLPGYSSATRDYKKPSNTPQVVRLI